MSSINQKLGLKPKTRIRAATHGQGIVSHASCPRCRARHVVEHEIHGTLTRLCAACGHCWELTADERRAEEQART